jgi:hypothetical protein
MPLRFTSIFVLALFLPVCSKSSGGGGGGSNIMTLDGTVAIPPKFKIYPVFNNYGRPTSIEYLACPAQNNSTTIKGPVTVVHTQTNCSDQQFVHFFEEDNKDLSDYADGTIEVRLQATAGAMTLNAFIQDANTLVSNTLDVSQYGFDPTKTGVEQKISIPVSALTSGIAAFDLANVKRVLQFNIGCSSANCYLSIYNVQWRGGTETSNGLTTTSTCPKRGCGKANTGSIVRWYMPTSYGWKSVVPTATAVTTDDGSFSAAFDKSRLVKLLKENIPIALAVSEPNSEFTFMYSVTLEEMSSKTLDVDISVESTLTAMMQCPGGVYPPPSGGYCVTATNDQRDTLQEAIAEHYDTADITAETLLDLSVEAFSIESIF